MAGIKSPVPAAAAGGGDTGAENTIEALLGWGFARPPVCEIVLDGREESVRSARMLVLVLLDELVSPHVVWARAGATEPGSCGSDR